LNQAASGASSAGLTPGRASLAVLLAACVAHYWICHTLTSEIALDVDPINLVYGMREFNLAHYAPHPPGYLVYVWMLRGLHAAVAGDSLGTVQLMARLLSTLTIPLVYLSVRMLRPGDALARGAAAVLTAFHPFLIYHAVDAQTHTSEALAAAILLLATVRYLDRPSSLWAAALGASLALGSAFRPSFVVAAIGPIVWAIGFRRFAHLGVATLSSLVGALAWLLPTFRASGGFGPWRAANDALIQQTIVRTSSPLSAQAIPSFVAFNLKSTALWLLLALAPALVAILMRTGSATPPDAAFERARSIALWSAGPALVFYLAMFCSEPGYLLGFVPAVIAVTALAASPELSPTRRRLALVAAGATQLVILMLPPASNEIAKIPSVPELVRREVLYRAIFEQINEKLPKDARVLYVSDFQDVVLSRQLPLLRSTLHSMVYHREYEPPYQQTSISYATQDDWIPLPGPILLQPGPAKIVDMPFTYDFVVIDPIASADLREQLARTTNCEVGSADGTIEVAVLPTKRCFPEGIVESHGRGVRFQLPAAPSPG
jgi:Dolichyl-phosphate-mannose-protein mannosyltransferase